MLRPIASAVLALLFFGASGIRAEEEITVTHAWVKSTAPGQKVAGAYFEIRSPAPSKLIAASSPVAGSAEIHSMRLQNGVMEMRQLKSLDLPARQTIQLAPGGMHIMLLDLKRSLKPGEKVPLRLTVLRGGQVKSVIEVQAEVRSVAP